MKLLLSQRAKLRKQLETFGDVKTWLDNKPTITSSEFKVLCMIRQEQTAPKRTLIPVGKPKGKPLKHTRQPIPQLRLPKPPVLSDMYAFLRSRKIKILEVFSKADRSENHRISREDFLMAVKAVSMSCSAGLRYVHPPSPGLCSPEGQTWDSPLTASYLQSHARKRHNPQSEHSLNTTSAPG